jgi:5'-deoxynucleotidase YfbR-like HD superfamily hydrolase
MTLEEYTSEKILEDVKGLQYLFELKEVIRSHQSRDKKDTTESVAEHVYGMHVLSQYFLPLENPGSSWDRSLISELINVHDVDEIETGDIVGWAKTPEDRLREEEAQKILLHKIPHRMRERTEELLRIYKEQNLIEAKFVKAIDKLEPHVHFFREKRRVMFALNKVTAEKAMGIKEPYMVNFPFIQKCNRVIHEGLLKSDYYWKEGK